MRYALLDNATLTSIQRLLGDIQVKNKSSIDNDVLSLENYVQAILFYDELICIDDYKQEFRSKRMSYFPEVKFVSKDLFKYDAFVESANKITEDIVLEVNAGKINDSVFKEYFQRLKMNYWFTWDMSSSNFFLTQKMMLDNGEIDQESFAKLQSIILKEGSEIYESVFEAKEKEPILIDSNGYVLSPGHYREGDGLSSIFSYLVNSLNWMSQRTAFYALASDYLQADLFLQPIRQEFLQNVIKRISPGTTSGRFNNFLCSLNDKADSTLKEIFKTYNDFSLTQKIPLFSAYFVHQTKNPKYIIEAAYEKREDKVFSEARNKLRELNQLIERGKHRSFLTDLNLLTSDLNVCFDKILSKYGLKTNQGFALSQLKFLWSIIPYGDNISVPAILDIRLKKLEFLKHLVPQKGFRGVYRNLIDDLTQIERLGKYNDLLKSEIVYHKEAREQKIATEQPRYKKASSYWKKPM